MTRKSICILIAFICVAGVTGIFGLSSGFGMDWFSAGKLKEPLKEFSYTRGGDMRGSFNSLSVKPWGPGQVIISSVKAEWHGAPFTVKEYVVSDQLLKEMQGIFNEYNMAGLGKRPKSIYEVLDAATSSYEFTFEGKVVKFSSQQNIPKKGWEGARKICKLVESYGKEENRLPGLVFPEGEKKDGTDYSPRHLEKGKLRLTLQSYWNNNLAFYVNNGTEQELKLSDAYSIVQLTPVQREIVAYQGKYTNKYYASHVNEENISLKQRLEAGRYRLTFGGLETEFEIK